MPDVAELIARHAPWAAHDRRLRLTPFEQFMWLDDRPDYPLVFEVVLRFAGQIDPDAMAGAWRFALARHPLLRARIVMGAEGPQWHAPAGDWRDLVVTEGSRQPPDDPTASDLPRIDLEREAGLRGELTETHDGWDVRLLFHHACCDGHGARMFLQDLVLAYVVLREACEDAAPFFRVDVALLDERGVQPRAVGKRAPRWRRLAHVLRFALRRPAPVASDVARGAEHAPGRPSGSVLGHLSHTFSTEEVAGMDAVQQRFAATRNDIAFAMLFKVLADWQRERGLSPRTRMRVAVPIDLRSRADERMPAANRYTYIFLERTLAECREWEPLVPGLQRDFQQRSQEGRGGQFLDALRRAAPFRSAMRWCLRRRTCFSTAVLTNLSDPSWRLRKRLPVDAEGLMWLDKAQCIDIRIRTPPLRPGTGWGIGIFEYAGRMTVSFRYDTTVLSSAAADAIMSRYVGHWRAILSVAGQERRPTVEPAVTASEAP